MQSMHSVRAIEHVAQGEDGSQMQLVPDKVYPFKHVKQSVAVEPEQVEQLISQGSQTFTFKKYPGPQDWHIVFPESYEHSVHPYNIDEQTVHYPRGLGKIFR